MQLRFTRGVGVALAIAVGCAVLGFVMAPGWWFFASTASCLALLLSLGGRFAPRLDGLNADPPFGRVISRDLDYGTDPSMKNAHAGNVTIDWSSVR